MATDTPHILLHDNNFFRKLVHKETGEAFARNLNSSGSPFQTYASWAPWRTPFSFIEWIGLNTRRLPKPPPFQITSPVDEDLITRAFHHFKDHYQDCEELTSKSLREYAEEQEKWLFAGTEHHWHAAMRGVTDCPGTPEWLHTALAFDAVHKIDPPGSFDADFFNLLLAYGFIGEPRTVQNYSKFRLAKRLWDRRWNELSGETQEECKSVADAMRIKNQSDFLDTDLIHLAVMGVEVDDANVKSIIAFTCDQPDVLKIRLSIYRGLLDRVRLLYKDELAEGFGETHNGMVHCIDQEGHLIESIDVANDVAPIRFLATD